MKLLSVFLLVVSGLAFAAPQNVSMVYDNAAVMHFCQPGLAGCAQRIELGGQSYLLEPLSSAKESVSNIAGAYAFHKLYVTQPGKVTGFVVLEKGHFPNPTVEFEVFKLLDANFLVPR